MAEKTVPAMVSNGGSNGPQTNGGNREMTRASERYAPPPVDIYETPNSLVLLADMPGVPKENLEVRVDQNTLTIQGKAQHLVKGEPIYREIELTGFFRQFEISEEIATDKINAELKYGVLSLNLPKSEKAKPKKIEVKVS
jgi:HSP20 family molecular chaperone IbpA